ncbi:MAG TPA: hypothetical protein VMS08_05085 [Candidatus Saccharimonadia bacterium]|nr:hypothetical protein [Candidatus Saccharimonadia bacterium]
MFKRTLAVLVLLSFPLIARADSATSLTDSDISQPNAATSELGPAATTDLGPAAASATGGAAVDGTSSSGGSASDGTSLQPAGTTPLQSTTGDSNGLSAADSNDLQQSGPASSGALQVVLGDADGPTHEVASASTNYWGWLWFTLIFGLMVASLSLVMKKPMRFVTQRVKRFAK